MLIVPLVVADADAHSWYPHWCCNDQDCQPVDTIQHNADGSMEITAGGIFVQIPKGFPSDVSGDRRIHVCTYYDPDVQLYRPRCLFLPATS
ncbi:MAG: hypothetical protein ACOYLQ_02615 [Hyphomicrobiaceae bacterium]